MAAHTTHGAQQSSIEPRRDVRVMGWLAADGSAKRIEPSHKRAHHRDVL